MPTLAGRTRAEARTVEIERIDGRDRYRIKHRGVLVGGTLGRQHGLVATPAEVDEVLGENFTRLQAERASATEALLYPAFRVSAGPCGEHERVRRYDMGVPSVRRKDLAFRRLTRQDGK
jgi:hypothetical protein